MAAAALLVVAAVAGAGSTAAGGATRGGRPADPVASPNWSGYVATGKPGTRFSSVTGTWRQPAVSCRRGHDATFSTIAVGLGGWGRDRQAVEQVGTDANCSASGKPAYYGWFDMAPYPSYPVGHRVSPGDVLTATVSLVDTAHPPIVRVELDDATAGWHFAREISWVSAGTFAQVGAAQNAGGTLLPAASSAEWLVEAPSTCRHQACSQASLADFRSVGMTRISAVAGGAAGTLANSDWKVVRLRLVPGRVRLPSYPRATPFTRNPAAEGVAASPAGAMPGPVSPDGRSFRVAWQRVAAKGVL